MSDSEIIEQLFNIITELDKRECSNNCSNNMKEISWKELCNIGIYLFKQLKQTQ